MAAGPSPASGMPVGGMAAPQGEEAETPAERDPRVRCYNKRLLGEVLEMCSDFSKAILQSQPQLSPERRGRALQEARWNFETTVQENVTVNGLPWQEASESQNGLNIKILEEQFDEVIVDTATKRKYHPRKILTHVSKTFKAEREMLEHYQPVVHQDPIRCNPDQVSRMANLTVEMSAVSKMFGESMKSLPTLIETTDGLSQVLSMHPVVQLSRTHKEVFSHNSSEEKETTIDLARGLEITPTDSETTKKTEPNRKRKRSHSTESELYPLRARSKRKINLSAAQTGKFQA